MKKKKKDVMQVTFRDVDIALVDLARLSHIHESTLLGRVNAGWNLETACLAKPTDQVHTKTSHVWITTPERRVAADKLFAAVLTLLKKQNPKKQKTRTGRNKVKTKNTNIIEMFKAFLEKENF